MREIEFRGKLRSGINEHKPAGSWIYGGYYLGKHGACIHEEGAAIGLRVDPETVGEYTGLKDRNGAKIFEGDILEIDYGKFGGVKGVIEWSKKECAFMAVAKNYCPYSLAHVDESPEAVKILGNTHDNPRLLARKEE
jgi:uncharacterized phage protein (TIGR01671 family)